MTEILDLNEARTTEALQAMAEKCRNDMKQRWPQINFDADVWPVHTIYSTKMLDVRFGPTITDFAKLEANYRLACRCLVARATLDGRIKSSRSTLRAWRMLHREVSPLSALRSHNMSALEEEIIKTVRPAVASIALNDLIQLSRMLDYLARSGVINHLAWGPSASTRATLRKISMAWEKQRRSDKSIEVLNRQIEGLSDATQAMLTCDERLAPTDRSAIAVANILMCAPSRINEPLTLRVKDRYTIVDYAKRPNGDEAGQVFQAHQLLLMKGSKGADWSGKPILNFMVGLSDVCWKIILETGERSRTLLEHYERSPTRLYLPPELEHLRGNLISKSALWKITQLSTHEPTEREIASVRSGTWETFLKKHKGVEGAVVVVENPRSQRSNGRKNSNNPHVSMLAWQAVEKFLLERICERMESMRWVTPGNRYQGPLSEMLMLVDADRSPYLPQAWDDKSLRARLKSPPWRMKDNFEKSVFIKLGLQMTKGGYLVDCYIDTHDVRRWLTTAALAARERLSDVLINKWANRINISQLEAYDLRTAEQKAHQVVLPIPQELQPITKGLEVLAGIELEYGLQTSIAVADGDGLAVTSIDAVMQATENRPVARSGNQILILYPNRFGICLHQHHETPCRAYASCSEGCNEQLTIKGHLPTNEEWHRREELTNRSILNQLQALITARQRGVADNPETLDSHLLTLLKGGNISTMTIELIERFHEIKEQVRDLNFRKDLEAAFISRGVVNRLDDPAVPSGALIKCHNPSKHAAPGLERAIEAQFGSREGMHRQTAFFHQKYPDLAPKRWGLKDERYLLISDDDEHENDE